MLLQRWPTPPKGLQAAWMPLKQLPSLLEQLEQQRPRQRGAHEQQWQQLLELPLVQWWLQQGAQRLWRARLLPKPAWQLAARQLKLLLLPGLQLVPRAQQLD